MNKISTTKIFLFFLIVGVEHINASSNNLRKRKATTTATSFIESISGLFMKEDWSCCDGTNEPTPVPTSSSTSPTLSVTSTPTTLRPTSIPTTQPTYAQKKLTASDGTISDKFGYSCSMSGELIVIGAKYAEENSQGAAYLYNLNGNEISKLTAGDDADDYDYFGHSVSIDETIVIGTYVSNFVQVFSLEGDYELSITCDECRFFGQAVATNGDRVVISGVQIHNTSWNWNLYIYTTEGELLKTIDNGDDRIYDVDISDEVIVFTTDLITYVHSNKVPDFEEIIEIPQAGKEVATSGDRVVIGDYSANTVWLYETNGTFIKTLEHDSQRFGSSVDISDDTIIVDAQYDDEVETNAGSVFIFSSDGDFQEKDLAPDGEPYDEFGSCVSASNSYFVAGAPGEDYNGSSSGAAYLFPLPD